MSREIKFRAWNEELEEMYELRKVDYLGSTGIIDPYIGGDKSIWQQYTGLKDKNGVEIYEGDIVEAYFWNDKLKPVKERGFIEFQSGSFIFNFGNGTWEYLDGNEAALVIGNIYENTELLEEITK